jgi:hypothetical protein
LLFNETSDEFFLNHDRGSLLGDAHVDLAFIDGLHEYSQVLRDFANVEQWSSPASTVVLHDVLPPTVRAASRERVSGQSCGDVWQIVACLNEHRPDLACFLIDSPPAGLLIVQELDPLNQVLAAKMQQILGSVPVSGPPYERAVVEYLASVSPQAPEDIFVHLQSTVRGESATSEPVDCCIAVDAEKNRAPIQAPPIPPAALLPREPMNRESVVPGLINSLTDQAEVFRIGPELNPRVQPLDPGQFKFFGFGESLPRVERAVRSVGIRNGLREVTVVDHALVQPIAHAYWSNDREPSGVFDAAGRSVSAASLTRKGGRRILGIETRALDNDEVLTLDEEVVFLGWYRAHFGHFLLESMARTWVLGELPSHVRVMFLNGSATDDSPVPRDILKALGVPAERVLEVNRPFRIRRLIIPEPLYELGFAAHAQASHPHRVVAERIQQTGRAGRSDQPVYLSRRMLRGGTRHVAGEAQFEDLLRENGVLVVYPDGMGLADQVRIFNRHADIICLQGSGAHGILFALEGPRLHILTPPTIIADYFLTSVLAGSKTTFISCLSGVTDGGPNFPLSLDAGTLCNYLSDAGLLKVPWSGDMMIGNPAISKEFDELVTFARVVEAPRLGQNLDAEALTLATARSADFWPLALALADYHLWESGIAPEPLVHNLVDQMQAERDLGRLIRYRPHVTESVPRIAPTVDPKLAQALATVVCERFGVDCA